MARRAFRVVRGLLLAPAVVALSILHGLWIAVAFVAVYLLPFALLRDCAGG